MSQSRASSTSRQRQQNVPIPQNKAQNKTAYIQQLAPNYKSPAPPPPLSSKTSYQAQNNNEIKKPKLTIGQTIGLITIRLSRVENQLTTLKQGTGLQSSYLDEPNNANTELLQSSASNMFYEFPNVNHKEDIDALASRIDLVESSLKTVVKVESDLQTTKDLLFILMSKHEKYALETNAKLETLQREVAHLASSKLDVGALSDEANVEAKVGAKVEAEVSVGDSDL